MVKNNKNKNIGLLILITFFLALVLIVVVQQPQLIYGGTGTTKFDNGKQAWIIDSYLSNLDTKPATVTFSTSEMKKAADDNLIPKDSETIDVNLVRKECVYDVEGLYEVGTNGYYKVFNPQLDMDIQVKARSTGDTKIFDLAKSQTTEIVSEKRGGQITAAVTGVELKSYCFIPDNARILKIDDKVYYLDADQINAKSKKYAACTIAFPVGLITCFATGVLDPTDMIEPGFQQTMTNLRFDLTSLRGTISKQLGSVHVILTADKEYFDAEPVATQHPTGKPVITDVNCPDLSSGYDSSMSVVVKNDGNLADIEVEVDGQNVNFDTSVSSRNINTGEKRTYFFVLKPINVEEQTSYKINIRASSQQQLGTGETDIASCTAKISPKTVLPPLDLFYCGDGNCAINENFQTCPQDCKTPICDATKNEYQDKDSGKCVCPEGYHRNEENYCVEDVDYLIYILLGMVMLFVIIILLLRRQGTKKRSFVI